MSINEDLNDSNISSNQSNAGANYVMSVCWKDAKLAASYYNIETMQLFVMQEIVDLRQNFQVLNNLFRQISPGYILMAGPNIFLREVLRLMNVSDEVDPNFYKVGRKLNPSSANIVVFTIDDKSLNINQKRVLKIKFPGMPQQMTESEILYFIQTVLPFDQNLTIQSLGNLMQYLDTNWKHIFLRGDQTPVITDLSVFLMQNQVLIDEATLFALQAFSSSVHPSGFKKGIAGASKEGFSLYGLLNRCCSKIGSNELKTILQQPTCDINELNFRHSTISWLLIPDNIDIIHKFKKQIKKISNIDTSFGKILACGGKPRDWLSFRRSVYHSYLICEICRELVAKGEDAVLINKFSELVTNNSTLENILCILERVIDFEESVKQEKFVVNEELDMELDRKKNQLQSLQASLQETAKSEINGLPDFVAEFIVTYIPGFGFVIGIPSWGNDQSPNAIENEKIRFVFKAGELFYYKTNFCDVLDNKYGHVYPEICEHEQRICDRTINVIKEDFPVILEVIKLCAKLDCLMALAEVALEKKYVKPEMTSDKVLFIQDGRHPLIEIKGDFIPNDTNVCVEDKNLITILSAPNASGKSVYLKQVALIAFMAHIGSFVPATNAKIGLLKSIYSRIYSLESAYQGTSSFLCDLQQMGRIMINSSSKSLILIDEFGKGTNPDEGRALLAASIESLISRGSTAPISFISTHYAEVFDMIKTKENTQLRTFEVIKDNDTLVPMYKLINGRNLESYATNLLETKQFINDLLSETLNSSITAKMNEIYKCKIEFAHNILTLFVNNNNYVDVDEVDKIYQLTKLN